MASAPPCPIVSDSDPLIKIIRDGEPFDRCDVLFSSDEKAYAHITGTIQSVN
jgi:hypothetical protein